MTNSPLSYERWVAHQSEAILRVETHLWVVTSIRTARCISTRIKTAHAHLIACAFASVSPAPRTTPHYHPSLKCSASEPPNYTRPSMLRLATCAILVVPCRTTPLHQNTPQRHPTHTKSQSAKSVPVARASTMRTKELATTTMRTRTVTPAREPLVLAHPAKAQPDPPALMRTVPAPATTTLPTRTTMCARERFVLAQRAKRMRVRARRAMMLHVLAVATTVFLTRTTTCAQGQVVSARLAKRVRVPHALMPTVLEVVTTATPTRSTTFATEPLVLVAHAAAMPSQPLATSALVIATIRSR